MPFKKYDPMITAESIKRAFSQASDDVTPASVISQKLEIEKKKDRSDKLQTIFFVFLAAICAAILIGNALVKDSPSADNLGFRMVCSGVYVVIFIFIFMFTKPKNHQPLQLEKVIQKFYAPVWKNIKPSIEEYFLLYAGEMAALSFDEFSQGWENWKETWKKDLGKVDAEICKGCGKESEGIWTKKKYYFDDLTIRNAPKYIKCRNCGNVFCGECYLKLEGLGHKCRVCGKNLREMGPNALKTGSNLLVVDPSVLLHKKSEKIELLDVSENSVEFVQKYQFTVQYQVIPNFFEFVDDYVVELKLHNHAIKMNDEWRLLAGLPDEMRSASEGKKGKSSEENPMTEVEGEKDE